MQWPRWDLFSRVVLEKGYMVHGIKHRSFLININRIDYGGSNHIILVVYLFIGWNCWCSLVLSKVDDLDCVNFYLMPLIELVF